MRANARQDYRLRLLFADGEQTETGEHGFPPQQFSVR
jgi:hypothetical protein